MAIGYIWINWITFFWVWHLSKLRHKRLGAGQPSCSHWHLWEQKPNPNDNTNTALATPATRAQTTVQAVTKGPVKIALNCARPSVFCVIQNKSTSMEPCYMMFASFCWINQMHIWLTWTPLKYSETKSHGSRHIYKWLLKRWSRFVLWQIWGYASITFVSTKEIWFRWGQISCPLIEIEQSKVACKLDEVWITKLDAPSRRYIFRIHRYRQISNIDRYP